MDKCDVVKAEKDLTPSGVSTSTGSTVPLPGKSDSDPAFFPPEGLGPRGAGLWRSTRPSMIDRPPPTDLILLEELCRCADELEDLHASWLATGATVAGSTGQLRPNPVGNELRLHRVAMANLAERLAPVTGLTDLDRLILEAGSG